MGTSAIDPAVPGAAVPPVVADPATPPVDPAVPPAGVPEKYDLKLPEGSTVDPALTERTAAKARALGLNNEAAQTLLDAEVADAVDRETAAKAAADTTVKEAKEAATTALLDAWKPGGDEWKKQQAEWVTAAKADPSLGKTPEQFAQSLEKGQQALARFGTPELKTYLDQTGFGSHPEVLKFLAAIGRASSESGMPTLITPSGGGTKTAAQILYGDTDPKVNAA